MNNLKSSSTLSRIKNFLFGYTTKEEELRKASILNLILIGNIILSFIAVVVNIIRNSPEQNFMAEILSAVLLLSMWGLRAISKKVSSRLASLILIGIFSFLSYYLAYQWGTIIPNSWMGLALTIVMGGILISSKFCIFLILSHSAVLLTLTHLQISGKIAYSWWDIAPDWGSVLVTIIILSIMVLISWLSNRQIEEALRRAWKSEKALKKERDSLEVKVRERTIALRKSQLEKEAHIYRFANFGRLTAGLFHDLVNPLNVVSLNLEYLRAKTKNDKRDGGRQNSGGGQNDNLENARSAIKRATISTKQMERFVRAARKQIQMENSQSLFDIRLEMKDVLESLNHKTKKARVEMDFVEGGEVKTYGNSLRFHQMMLNLISNAIDSYEKVSRRKNRKVIIRVEADDEEAMITVQDFGVGIPKKDLEKIFDPFFTTKSIDKGTGLGLSICKDIARKEFEGKITVESEKNKGSVFLAIFPIKNHVD